MKYFNLVFFFISSLLCFSQQNDSLFIRGQLVKKNFKELKIANIPDDSGGLFTLRYRKKQAIIRHYSKDLLIDLEYAHELGSQTILSTFVLNNQLNLITYRVDKKTKDAIFNSNIFNSDTKTIKEDKLFTIPSKQIALKKKGLSILPSNPDEYEVLNPFEGNYQWGFQSNSVVNYLDFSTIQPTYDVDNTFQWGIKFSKNKKYYVIGFTNFEQGKKNKSNKQKEAYRFYFLNDKNQLLFDQVITLEHKDRNYYFYDIEVDEDLEAFYFLGKHFPKGSGGAFKYPDYEYEIHRITKDSASYTSVNIDNLKINDLILNVGASANNVSAVGLYSNNSNYSVEGLAYFSFDKTNLTPLLSTHTKFSEQFFKDSQGKKEEYHDFYIDNLFETSNGEVYVIGEERKTVSLGQASGFDPFGMAYYYSDLFVAKLDVYGKILWSRAIKKNQIANRNDLTSLMSYTSYLSEKDEINVIFNASQKLKTLKDGSTLYDFSSFKKIIPFHLNFNNFGDYSHEELLKQDEKLILETANYLYDNLNTPSSVFFLAKQVNKEMWIKYKL